MTEVATNKVPQLSNEQINDVLQHVADRFGQSQRSPVLHSPSEQNLDYENVTLCCAQASGSQPGTRGSGRSMSASPRSSTRYTMTC